MKFKQGHIVVYISGKAVINAEVQSASGDKVTLVKEDGTTSTVAAKNVQLKTKYEDAQAKAKIKAEKEEAKAAALAAKPPKAKREPKERAEGELVKSGQLTYDPSKYVRHTDAKTASGNTVRDINDDVAKQLRTAGTPDKMYSIAAKALGEKVGELKEKYSHLNPGMQRMVLGNRLRGAQRQAEAEIAGSEAA